MTVRRAAEDRVFEDVHSIGRALATRAEPARRQVLVSLPEGPEILLVERGSVELLDEGADIVEKRLERRRRGLSDVR